MQNVNDQVVGGKTENHLDGTIMSSIASIQPADMIVIKQYVHDINNILSAIIGKIELMRPTALAGHDLNVIHDSALRASQLTRILLNRTLINEAPPEDVDLHGLIHETIVLMHGVIPSSICITECLRAENPHILGSHACISSAIINALLNARDSMPQGGTVTLTSRNALPGEALDTVVGHDDVNARRIVLSISDTGLGFDRKVIENLFNPHNTTKSFGHGLGLLSLRETMRMHNGAIGINTKIGVGTTVCLIFPQQITCNPVPTPPL